MSNTFSLIFEDEIPEEYRVEDYFDCNRLELTLRLEYII